MSYCRSHGIVIYCGSQRIKNVACRNSRNQDSMGLLVIRVYENIGRTITNFFRKTNFFYRFFLPIPFNYNYLQYLLVFWYPKRSGVRYLFGNTICNLLIIKALLTYWFSMSYWKPGDEHITYWFSIGYRCTRIFSNIFLGIQGKLP